MYRTLILILALFIAGCASESKIGKSEDTGSNEKVISAGDSKKKALEHFIAGSTAETKGDYATAILEFQDALRLDPDAGIHYALAKNYLYLNRLPLALQHSKKSVEMDSTPVEYYELLADIFSVTRQYDSAAVVLEKLISKDSLRFNSYYKLARIYETSKPLQAITIYERLSAIVGPEWSILVRVAELYEQLGRNEDAIRTIEELLEIDPANIPLQKLLSELYQRVKRYDEAIAVIEEILELTPDDLDARERKAQIFIEQGNWNAAADEYSYFLSNKDIPLESKIRIGSAYFARSLNDSTLTPTTKKFFETIDKDTTDWQVKMFLGAIAINEKNDSSAIKYFEEVTQLANWNVEGWIRLGGLYFDNGKYKEAAKLMHEAILQFPDEFAINLILGLSLAQDNQHEQALEHLKKSVDLNPQDLNALSAYAYTLSQLKQNEDAISYLKKALLISPDDVNILGTLGLIYNSLEMWNECDSTYSRALEIDSMNALVNNNYAYSLSERGVNLEAALSMVKISIEAEPDNTSYLDTIGWVYYKLGNYEQAKHYLEKAIEIGGERPVMLDHLGDVLFKMGQREYALELWQKAYDLDTSNQEIKTKIEKGEI
ncbi:MAG: tetratricopeptide repeat protein [Ignavibacteriales bacterium]|nr:MAG: tetratricopeptide repeat protein [Ignavibacteriales bacterium]